MTFSVIVKLQTSRRFVSSSSCGAPFEKFVTSGIGQRGGGGNMRAAEHFLTNILTVWTHNQWSLVFIDFCGFKHLFLNKNSWKQQNGHLTTKVLTWITRGYLDIRRLQVFTKSMEQYGPQCWGGGGADHINIEPGTWDHWGIMVMATSPSLTQHSVSTLVTL